MTWKARECAARPITTERLQLEPLRVEHAAAMVPVLADSALYEFTGGTPPSLDELSERYGMQVAGPGRVDEQWLNWIVFRRVGGDAVGFVQATVEGSRSDIAWLIGVEHQGHGFATEATRAMIRSLGQDGIRAFDAHIHPDHRSSQGVARAAGLGRSGAVDDDGEEIWTIKLPAMTDGDPRTDSSAD